MKEEQTKQWTKEKVQRSTKHTYKTKDRVTRTSLKTMSCSGSQLGFPINTKHTHFIED